MPARSNGAAPPDVDPELLSIRLPRRRLASPVLSAVVIILAGYLMFRMRADFAYALRSRTPVEAGAVSQPLRRPELPGDNQYVRVTAVPDRAFPLRVGEGKSAGYRVERVLGTGGQLWLQLRGDDSGADQRGADVYSGRTRRLSALPYGSDVSSFLAAARAPRLLALEQLRALATLNGSGEVEDVLGERIRVTPRADVVITEEVATSAIVTISRAVNPDRAAADALVTGLGDAGAPVLIDEGRADWRYRVPLGASGFDALKAALKTRSITGKATHELAEHRASADALKLSGDAVEIGAARVPLSSIRRVLVYAPVLSGDPIILQVGESPADYWYYPVIYGALLLFLLFNAWGLYTLWREHRLDTAARGGTR